MREREKIAKKEETGKKEDGNLAKYYKGILKDPSEFWKFMMDDGMLNFLIDVYDERIEEIEPNDKSESNLGY